VHSFSFPSNLVSFTTVLIIIVSAEFCVRCVSRMYSVYIYIYFGNTKRW
jgi:hypothetical protein